MCSSHEADIRTASEIEHQRLKQSIHRLDAKTCSERSAAGIKFKASCLGTIGLDGYTFRS